MRLKEYYEYDLWYILNWSSIERCHKIPDFEEYYEKSQKKINERLTKILEESKYEEMEELLNYSIKGGKRFRPTLCLLVSDIFGGNKDDALTKAAIVEFIHSSTLVHDDVVDNDKVRREMPSLWNALDKIPYKGPEEFNPKNLAMLLGDGMLSKALILIKKPEVLRAVADSIYSVANGAIKESKDRIANIIGSDSDMEEYLKTIRLKTGSLFALSTHLGAMTGNASKRQKELARSAGLKLGIIYQMADDLADQDLILSEEETKELLVQYVDKFMKNISKFPENKYRKLFEEVPLYIVNKMMIQDQRPLRLEKNSGNIQWTKSTVK